jgi:hypothetical protein
MLEHSARPVVTDSAPIKAGSTTLPISPQNQQEYERVDNCARGGIVVQVLLYVRPT